jgi:hypothetical protein
VTYDLPGTTTLQSISSAGGLTLAGGNLVVSGGLTTARYAQNTGNLTGGGGLTVTNGFSQATGTSIGLGGPVSITQSSGNLAVGAISAPSISLTANNGSIAQVGALSTSGLLNLQAGSGIQLTDSGNKVARLSARVTGAGDVDLVNTGVLSLEGVTTSAGSIRLVNTGGVTTGKDSVAATGGGVSLKANSPLTVGDGGVSATGDVNLEATNLTSAGDVLLNGNVVSSTGAVAITAAASLTQNGKVTAAKGVTVASSGPRHLWRGRPDHRQPCELPQQWPSGVRSRGRTGPHPDTHACPDTGSNPRPHTSAHYLLQPPARRSTASWKCSAPATAA